MQTRKTDKLDYIAFYLGFMISTALIITSYFYLKYNNQLYGVLYSVILTYYIFSFVVGNYTLAIFETYNYYRKNEILNDIKIHSKIDLKFALYNSLLLTGLTIPFLFKDNIVFKGISGYIIVNLIYQLILQYSIFRKYIKYNIWLLYNKRIQSKQNIGEFMTVIIEDKIMFIFGVSKLSEVSEDSLKSIFRDLNNFDLVYDSKNKYTQIVNMWETKNGEITIL